MRVLAILAAYNERRFIAACLENLIRQGLDVYLIDNGSTDETVAIAERYRGRGLIGIEHLPRDGVYCWEGILRRKAEVAAQCEHAWVMHVDADEIRLPPPGAARIADALAVVDAAGYNAVDFTEFSFVPTRETPDHDHPRFQQTMRWYYPFQPSPLYRLTLWKRQAAPVDLVGSGGHQVRFPGIRPWPVAFPMRHYLFLSPDHAKEKWIDRRYAAEELDRGWHRARARLREPDIRLQSEAELRCYSSDAELDARDPLIAHPLFAGTARGG
jgi:hypothetical protein